VARHKDQVQCDGGIHQGSGLQDGNIRREGVRLWAREQSGVGLCWLEIKHCSFLLWVRHSDDMQQALAFPETAAAKISNHLQPPA
jgi:hypothetical protein